MVKELKHTEIGDIPVDWELQTFDETFRVISNNTLSRENLNNRGGAVRNIHYGDILTKFPEVLDCNEEEIPYVNELSLLSSSTQLLQDGDIVVADTAEDETVGKVIEVQNLGDSKLVAGLHTIPCRVKKGDFAPGWLGYYMNSDLFHNQILPYITGIKVSSISKGAISETLILVPPFDEQEKIVQSLNKIQLLMTSETKVVNKIKLVKNGCLSKMFPQKDDTVPEMRLPGFTEAWEQRKFSDIAARESFVSTSASDVPSVEYEDVVAEEGRLNKDIRLKEAVKSGITFDGSQVLYGKLRPYLHNWLNPDFKGIAVGDWWVLKPINMEKNFLYRLIQTQQFDNIANQSSGSKMPRADWNLISNSQFVVPFSKEEQSKIGGYFDNIDHLITLHQCKCDKYSNIKKGMMSDLLTGKIRLV
ncbi:MULTISPECIES: restriction endonuclease subunit S [unclassified Coprococcus]|uniref:restriction endonuclease subunit S n=1 Tax=unclassified Coprococcus TaxID=2684943 RepID=UPI000E5346C6|nr:MULTISPECIES: restriction endonuclease subunit S [unclassified Coprococcus]RGI37389.1 restriction endonuclease subunit S [Coprococcus sp. OM06-34AC]